MKLDWKQIVRPAAVLTIICVVVTAVLGGANALTKDAIAAQEAAAEQAARAEVLQRHHRRRHPSHPSRSAPQTGPVQSAGDHR